MIVNRKIRSIIFEGDTLATKSNSYAIVVFKDKSRISLQSNSVFRIDEMKFSEQEPDDNSALFSLLRGGLRSITGLIGRLNPRKYSMRTSVATIGIRGTGYDLMCTGVCVVTNGEQAPQQVSLPKGEGLYANVWEGAIDFGGQVVPTGKSAFISNRSAQPLVLPAVPNFFKNNTVPKPGGFEVDEKLLFSKVETEEAPPGLYVSVTDGNVSVENKAGQTLDLKAGQAAYADVLGRQAKPLANIPVFQQFDAYPMPDVSNPSVIKLNVNTIGGEEPGVVCEIK